MDSKYCLYLYRDFLKYVTGIGGMNVYKKNPHISNIERNTNKNVKLDWEFKPGTLASLIRCSTSELSRLINIHGSSWQNYHIPPLQIFLPSKKHTTNTCSPCHDLLIQRIPDQWSQHQIIKNEKKYRKKHFFYIHEGKIPKWFNKNKNTEPSPHLHPYTGTWIIR